MDTVRIPRRAIYGDTAMNRKTYKHLTPDMIELDQDEAWLLTAILRGGRITWGADRQQSAALVLAGLRVVGCIAHRDRPVVTGFGYRALKHHRTRAAARAQASLNWHVRQLRFRIADHPTTDANLALDSALAAYLETNT